MTPISILTLSPEPSSSERSYFMRVLKGISQPFNLFIFSSVGDTSLHLQHAKLTSAAERKQTDSPDGSLPLSLFPCAHISWEERSAPSFVTPSETFPVNAQSKLPFGDACLSLGSWDHSLKSSLDSSVYLFSMGLYYSVKMTA